MKSTLEQLDQRELEWKIQADINEGIFILISVWSYLNWMGKVGKDTTDAMEIVHTLKHELIPPCSSAVLTLANRYASKWREHWISADIDM